MKEYSLAPVQQKRRLKQLLHVGKTKLGWDDDFYREVLVSITKNPERNSSTQLTLHELEAAVDRMKRAGFIPVAKKAGSRIQAIYPQAKKIRSLWLTLRDKGALRDASEEALAAWVKGEFGVDHINWLSADQSHKAIERLKKWIDRLEVTP